MVLSNGEMDWIKKIRKFKIKLTADSVERELGVKGSWDDLKIIKLKRIIVTQIKIIPKAKE